MTIALRDLGSLDPTVVAQNLQTIATAVQEKDATLDLRFGILHNLLIYYHAVLETQIQANIQDYLNARSLVAIEADPALADPSLVDDVLSNFNLTRVAGATAQGAVAVVVSSNTTLTLAVGTIFQANGLQFVTQQVYTAKADAAQINNPGDVLLVARADGNFVFNINVICTTVGVAGNLTQNTVLVPFVTPANYVTSYAASDFTAGLDTETNAQLIAQLQKGIACKAPSNRVNFNAFLTEIPTFASVSNTSVIGYGDPEQQRDRHSIFPISSGGRVDWYVRTQAPLALLGLTKTATCVSINSALGTSNWQFNLTKDDAPGFYEVETVQPNDATNLSGSFPIVQDVRALDLTGPAWHPDLVNLVEGIYSRYQTAIIEFTDNITSIANLQVGSTATYAVTVSYLPNIDVLQDLFTTPDVRSRVADVLVKAPMPCFVTLQFTIALPTGQTVDQGAIATALAGLVQSLSFTGTLYAAGLQAVLAPLLNGGNVSSIDMLGRLRYPDGSTRYLRSNEVLQVPDDVAFMVTPRTVQFYLDPTDVGITLVTAASTDF